MYTTRPGNHRARWAAIGAAVAVSLGAGGLGIARAASSPPAAYSAMSPCRLFDTRAEPSFHVGSHTTLGPNGKLTADGWGDHGQCNLPTGTTALQLNVTAVAPTAATFLTSFPGEGDPPNASHLNPTPGEPPTPNAVTVQLDDAGRFSIFNKFGTVDVIVDVVGTYAPAVAPPGDPGAPHDHDDRYYTKAEVDDLRDDIAETVWRKADAEQTLMIPGNAFRPGDSATAYWASPYDGAYSNVDNAVLDAPVLLPEGALILRVKYHVRDSHAAINLAMALRAAHQPSGSDLGAPISSMNTFAAPGHTTLTQNLATPHAVGDDMAYFLRVTSAGWGTAAGDLRIKGVELTYILPGGYVN